MLDLPECDENGFDGLHCPRWYAGGSCSYCRAPAPGRFANLCKSTDSANGDAAGVKVEGGDHA